MPKLMDGALEEALQERISDVTKRYQEAGYFPTASVRVFDRDKTLAAAMVGQAKEDSLFDVASLTKIATTTMVLTYIDEGKLDLSDRLTALFPEIAADEFMCARLKDITLGRLLTHTSTIVDWYPFYIERGLPFFAVLKSALLRCAPSVGMVYSDLNYMLLGKLLERMSGLPLEACLQERLVKPLGLDRMTYRPDASLDLIPTGYGNVDEARMCVERGFVFEGFRDKEKPILGGSHDGNAYYFFDDVAGHAGIFAAPEAYEKLCRFYMNTARPIYIEAQKVQPGAPTRGLGFQVSPMYPHGCGHTGFTGTSIWFSREKNIGAVAFTNRLFSEKYNTNATNDYRRALHEAVYAAAACRG